MNDYEGWTLEELEREKERVKKTADETIAKVNADTNDRLATLDRVEEMLSE